jgi:hypothetical protein
MIQDRIAKIEAKLHSTEHLSPETRAELLGLLADLKAEVGPLAETHGELAQNITQYTDAAVDQATREDKQADSASEAFEGLTSSVRDFEVSHPRLVQIVDRLALTLSNMGI